MRDAFLRSWRGILIAAVLVAATVWLAATGRLGLYIHPRYFEFTVVMTVLGGIAVVAAFLVRPRAEHDHEHDGPAGRRRTALAVGGSAVLVVAVAAGLLAVPPATLSASLAADREVNATITADDAPLVLAGADTSAFTVKDWAVLIRQGGGESVLRGAEPTITGFVVPVDGDPDAFTVTRYAVTCCAVDAQPFGVTVVMPGWRGSLAEGGWVSATGRFAENPDASAAAGWVLKASGAVAIEEPSDPYVF